MRRVQISTSLTRSLLLVGSLTFASCGKNDSNDANGPLLGGASTPSIFSSQPDGSELVGLWATRLRYKDGSFDDLTARIERNGANFLVNFTSTERFGGIKGTFPATYQNGILQVSHPMIGGISYSQQGNSIFVLGREYGKATDEALARRAADDQAAAQAQQQAIEAQQEAQRQENEMKLAEIRRKDSIGVHAYNCHFNNSQCDQAVADFRNDPATASDSMKQWMRGEVYRPGYAFGRSGGRQVPQADETPPMDAPMEKKM